MKELTKKIVDQLTEEQLKTLQECVESGIEHWGDLASQNIDEFLQESQGYQETELTLEDVMSYTKVDWRMNEGLKEDKDVNWFTGERNN